MSRKAQRVARQDQQPVPSRRSTPFKRVDAKEYGYHPGQVDEFVSNARIAYEENDGRLTAEQVSTQSFDAIRGGYSTSQVDQMLDRLEDAFRRMERDDFIIEYGRDDWNNSLDEDIRALFGRLKRPVGQRFRAPSGNRTQGYRRSDVDALCLRLFRHLTDEDELSLDELRYAKFRLAQGQAAYDEAQVDALIKDAVAILVVLG